MGNQFDINSFYDTYTKMSTSERKTYISRLRQTGIKICNITCFSYSEAPGIKHTNFQFDNNKESIPYFLLSNDTLSKIIKILLEGT